ncbi:MAG: hypothetical protein ACQEQU_07165 [Spirochaetota bacterium]
MKGQVSDEQLASNTDKYADNPNDPLCSLGLAAEVCAALLGNPGLPAKQSLRCESCS